jgi:cyclohexa-1,5-dienecarbonyl-CoA hydratase
MVRLEVRDHVAWLTLDRPPLNILDIPLNRELASCVRSLAGRADVRVVALRGASGAFSAGVQIEDHAPSRVAAMLEAFHGVFRAFVELGRPLIAVVDGPALGGGCELAVFADACWASESSTFGFPEIRLGCFPPVAALVLPAVVGAHRAAELMLTGETISAERAREIGLVNEVGGSAEEFVGKFARLSGAALSLAREAAFDRGEFLRQLPRVEALYLERLMATHDASEGIAAWAEKRAPRWEDR